MRDGKPAFIVSVICFSALAIGPALCLAATPLGLGRALPPPSDRVHVPNSTQAAPAVELQTRHNFHGRDYARFTPEERKDWQAGEWRHEGHNGHAGWWWVVGGAWYFYPEPIYPYPRYVSDYTYPLPRIVSNYRYYCTDPPGFYPEVKECYDPWELIPPLLPPPNAIGLSENADVRAGYRIARDICSFCHMIDPNQTEGPILPQLGPRFIDIANAPGTTADSLEAFITSTGWNVDARVITMPNQSLSVQATREVASYIMSLRTRK
jgi:mono/diheme cytochrome c family protein